MMKRCNHAGSFSCGVGGRTIPCSKVNDDYCDCLSGRDEPGTAACPALPGRRFICAAGNQNISAAFVDDGVVDCADGSDEGHAAMQSAKQKP